jgi:hypothetical protein
MFPPLRFIIAKFYLNNSNFFKKTNKKINLNPFLLNGLFIPLIIQNLQENIFKKFDILQKGG